MASLEELVDDTVALLGLNSPELALGVFLHNMCYRKHVRAELERLYEEQGFVPGELLDKLADAVLTEFDGSRLFRHLECCMHRRCTKVRLAELVISDLCAYSDLYMRLFSQSPNPVFRAGAAHASAVFGRSLSDVKVDGDENVRVYALLEKDDGELWAVVEDVRMSERERDAAYRILSRRKLEALKVPGRFNGTLLN